MFQDQINDRTLDNLQIMNITSISYTMYGTENYVALCYKNTLEGKAGLDHALVLLESSLFFVMVHHT